MSVDEKGPIFIGGLSHSGKTQLRMVLGAHPEVSITRRTYMWDRFYGRFGDLSRPRNLDRCLVALTANKDVEKLRPDPKRIRHEFLEGPPTYARLIALVHQHHAQRMGKRRWGDQLGLVERFADPIFAAFPSGRIIHLIRDLRSQCCLNRTTTRGRRGKLGWETAMWLFSADLAERNRRLYPDKYRVLRYETLATHPEETVRELCGFLLEDYTTDMTRTLVSLRFDRSGSSSTGEDTTDYRGRRWLRDWAFTDMYARERLRTFDYPATRGKLSPRDRTPFWLTDWPLNRAGMVAWRVLKERSPAKRVEG